MNSKERTAGAGDVTTGLVIESLSIHACADEERLTADLANAFRSESMEFAESEISEAVAVARKR